MLFETVKSYYVIPLTQPKLIASLCSKSESKEYLKIRLSARATTEFYLLLVASLTLTNYKLSIQEFTYFLPA